MAAKRKKTANDELAEFVSEFYHDPAGFAKACFCWGEGALADFKGPLKWHIEILDEIGRQSRANGFDGSTPVQAIKLAISSGHGIAKTTLSSILGCWILSTRPKSKGKVTAQSWPQLESITWASFKFWLSQCVTASWFESGAHRIRHKLYPDVWLVTAESPKAENAQSFAGQHAGDSTSWILVDEASDLPEKIYQVTQGALTDGEPMMFLFGNCVHNSGVFHDIIFGERGHDWTTRVIDSRDVEITNKQLFATWAEEHGEDSDFFRVRVKGEPPRASTIQFIGSDLVSAAFSRSPVMLADDALVAGVDISRGGEADTVLYFRRGNDAKSIPAIHLSAEITRDSTRVISIMADQFSRDFGQGLKLSHMFADSTGVGGPLVDRLREMGHKRVTGINFGSVPPEIGYLNMRAYMWDKMREWLRKGGALEAGENLKADLIGPGYSYNGKSKLVLESKESMERRKVQSPDDADALALTFAARVGTFESYDPYAARDAYIQSLSTGLNSHWMT